MFANFSRRFAFALGASTMAAAAAIVLFVPTSEARATAPEGSEFHDLWLTELTGSHRQLFDSPQPLGGIPLEHILNYHNSLNSAYRVPDTRINAIGTFYGGTTLHGLNDAMWTKYGIADFLKGAGIDAGSGATPNPWRSNPTIVGMSMPDASIEALQRRGTQFIICNNALTYFATMLAQSKGLDPAAVTADWKANILPGVELVPAMVIAIGQAQDAGLAYHRQ
jgi:intracellular sulfur oxidation DsrE/DsrF family protein